MCFSYKARGTLSGSLASWKNCCRVRKLASQPVPAASKPTGGRQAKHASIIGHASKDVKMALQGLVGAHPYAGLSAGACQAEMRTVVLHGHAT